MQQREIPYNYTSLTDEQIVVRFLGAPAWDIISQLRAERQTGHSARLLFEILGDMWVIVRNPYIQDDLIRNKKRRQSFEQTLNYRVELIEQRANQNQAVLELVTQLKIAIKSFIDQLREQQKLRRKILLKLMLVTRKDNICFDGLSRIAHATDATDWRVEYPLVVLKPDSEAEILPIVKACIDCGLTIIPRGGGTGYTGGAIPLTHLSAVINTEKLQRLGEVEHLVLPGLTEAVPTVYAEAGVITRRVSDLANFHKLVFAVDPTSQDASTLGGNIAMNAGGKKAVLWGTTLDNLASWRMVMPNCTWLEVERLNHNLGKIHDQAETVFKITRSNAQRQPIGEPELLKIPGASLRKQGLGKDVTDKFLAGVPGIQKEGCDGLITSARFILHQPPKYLRTICLEFFGHDLQQAVPAIVEIKDYVEQQNGVLLSGLEHLDHRYLKAVKYSTKAARSELPKMVLLIDIMGDDETRLAQTGSEIVRLANQRNGEGFIAGTPAARTRFWLDRTRTAAIAAHTNAFKINEDVVIPLNKLADYTDGIERINIEYSLRNKLEIVGAVKNYLQELQQQPQNEEDEILPNKITTALALVQTLQTEWESLATQLDKITTGDTVFRQLQRRQLVLSFKTSVLKPLNDIFSGEHYETIRKKLTELHQQVLQGRLFVALHMHAGDGNVHTNIPVNSNDPSMLEQAEKIVIRVMALAKSLDGVISGEHGIGITKMAFLEPETITAFARYKQKIDPDGRFNKDKLLVLDSLERAFTPSLRLLQQEALLLEASELGALNDATKNCLRCGKCKPVCMTHIPQANMYYSPRDKILGTGALIEAFLYEEQTKRGISLSHFDEFNDIADHCTTCHKCFTPCPVDIDFGNVSIMMRNILRARGKKKFNLGTKIAMRFLNTTDPVTIKLFREVFVRWAFVGQRAANNVYRWLTKVKPSSPPASTTGSPSVKEQTIYFVKRPMPKAVPSKTARALIGAEDKDTITILRDPEKTNVNSDAVFYFPGCGSERLFSQIGLATFAMLYHAGVQTVLPPGYLCCGYPQIAAGDAKKGEAMSVNNRVLFHRIANSLHYLNINTIVVSCGTCIDQLEKYQLQEIFPKARLMDIHEYLMERNIKIQTNAHYLYHDPCHSPMKIHAPTKVASTLLGQNITQSKFCCGDAGTLSVSRPDIANQLKFRKENEIKANVKTLTGDEKATEVTMLTSCPACIKGLASYTKSTGIKTDYIVVELARNILGQQWQTEFVKRLQQGAVEKILL